MNLFHISKNPNLTTMIPRVPNSYVVRELSEDKVTKRVCFAPSVKDCISAIDSGPGELYYVYVATGVDRKFVYKPKPYQVPDVKYTNEIWYLKPVNVKRVGTVLVGDVNLWKTFKYKGNTMGHHVNNFKRFNGVPTEQQKNEYFATQTYYTKGLQQEKEWDRIERNKNIKRALASAAGGALLMLVGNKLLNMKK